MPSSRILRFHIRPGSVGALGQRILALVDLVVQDLQPKIGDADIINIREDQCDPGSRLLPILDCDVEFTADVTSGFGYL